MNSVVLQIKARLHTFRIHDLEEMYKEAQRRAEYGPRKMAAQVTMRLIEEVANERGIQLKCKK